MIANAKSKILNEISCTVIVVPTSAPKMIPNVCRSANNPASVNPTNITVVALLLCVINVITIPTNTPTNRFFVSELKIARSRHPAAF